MQQRNHSDPFLSYRKRRREAVLRKMAAMRAAKERKRMARGPVEDEPKMQRFYRFEYGIRDTITGETHWRTLTSIRQASKALGLIVKFCQ